jgi:cell division protein FtsZ
VQPGQSAPHTPASPTAPSTQHSWPTNGPSNGSGAGAAGTNQAPASSRPKKPEPEEDLDIPDFLK